MGVTNPIAQQTCGGEERGREGGQGGRMRVDVVAVPLLPMPLRCAAVDGRCVAVRSPARTIGMGERLHSSAVDMQRTHHPTMTVKSTRRRAGRRGAAAARRSGRAPHCASFAALERTLDSRPNATGRLRRSLTMAACELPLPLPPRRSRIDSCASLSLATRSKRKGGRADRTEPNRTEPSRVALSAVSSGRLSQFDGAHL